MPSDRKSLEPAVASPTVADVAATAKRYFVPFSFGFWNFTGAGVFGFLINMPIVSYFEIGTQSGWGSGPRLLMSESLAAQAKGRVPT